jgi:hypothetical protein
VKIWDSEKVSGTFLRSAATLASPRKYVGIEKISEIQASVLGIVEILVSFPNSCLEGVGPKHEPAHRMTEIRSGVLMLRCSPER